MKLKLNSDKTELLLIASRFRPRPHFPPLNICGDQIRASVSARNIGVIFDSYMNFECQVSSVCKASFFHIRNVSRIRKYLSVESTNQVMSYLKNKKLYHFRGFNTADMLRD